MILGEGAPSFRKQNCQKKVYTSMVARVDWLCQGLVVASNFKHAARQRGLVEVPYVGG